MDLERGRASSPSLGFSAILLAYPEASIEDKTNKVLTGSPRLVKVHCAVLLSARACQAGHKTIAQDHHHERPRITAVRIAPGSDS